jgi:hypothetical protein
VNRVTVPGEVGSSWGRLGSFGAEVCYNREGGGRRDRLPPPRLAVDLDETPSHLGPGQANSFSTDEPMTMRWTWLVPS